jgi:heme exporter protein B
MKRIWAIVWKDIITELRTKELFSSMFTFALLIILIFSFTFGFSVEFIPIAAPGILWVAFTFAGVLGLSRSFSIEKEGNSILGLLISPVDRSYIFLGKMVGNMIFVFIVEAIILPIFVLFFNYNLFVNFFPLLLVILLGTIGFVSVGTLFSAMAVNTRLREVLLPVLLFPVIIPVIVSSIKLIGAILDGKPIGGAGSSLQVLVSFDIIFLVVCTMVFEYVIEE